MKIKTAQKSFSIKFMTGFVALLFFGFLIGAVYNIDFLIPALIIGGIFFLCYVTAPISYEYTGDQIRVCSKIGKKEFTDIKKISRPEKKFSFGLRLWGNGGCFAATGIFWNKKFGKFRAYVTNTKTDNLVLLNTEKTKIVISPQNIDRFIESK
ncbi:MAG: PH domain-containing protein [Elusimicrobiota bacterium]